MTARITAVETANAVSVDRRVPAPVEATAEDGFHDQVVGGRGGADANADIDFPERRHIEVGDEEDLLLLVVHGRKAADRPIVGVPLEPPAHHASEVVANFGAGRKAKPLIDVRAVQRTLERGIDGEIPPADALVDDGAYLPSPCVGRVCGALEADLGR